MQSGSTKNVEGPSHRIAESIKAGQRRQKTVITTKGEKNGKKSSRKNQASN